MKKYFAILLCLFASPAFAIEKNVASQYLELQAIDSATGAPKTGDAANLTAYVSGDGDTTPDALSDTSATEIDSTKYPGIYRWDLTQAETNFTNIAFGGKSTTSGVYLVPRFIATVPANFGKASIDSNGRIDLIKIAGTTQTARDIGASVLLSAGTGTGQLDFTAGVVKSNTTQLAGSAIQQSGGYAKTIESSRPQYWYVRTTSGSDSNDGLKYSTPFLTLQHALDTARSGDTIFIRNGNYTAETTIDIDAQNKSNLTLLGESESGVIISTVLAEHGTTVRNLTITANGVSATIDNGTGVFADAKTGVTIEHCTFNTSYDGFRSLAGRDAVVRHCRFSGTYDVINLWDHQGFVLEDNWFTVDGSYPNVANPNDPYRAATFGYASRGICRNCTFEIANTTADVRPLACVDVGGTNSTPGGIGGEDSHVVFENCLFKGRRTNASSTGRLRGITTVQNVTGPYHCLVDRNCRFDLVNSGSGGYDEIDANYSGVTIRAQASNFDTAKCTGLANITTDLAPTTALSKVDVASTGEVGLDFNNIKDASGSHTLTNITVPSVASVSLIGSGGITSSSFASNSITAAAVASDAATEIGAAASSAASGGPIEQRKVVASRILTVRDRGDGNYDVVGKVRMKKSERFMWALELKGTQLAPGGDLYGMSEPTLSGAEAAHMTVQDYGVDHTLAKFEVSTSSSAATTDTIQVDVVVQPTATETITIAVPVEIGS